MVSDTVTLGSQLVMIAGQRLNYVLSTTSNRPNIIVLVSPLITEWVQTLVSRNLFSSKKLLTFINKMNPNRIYIYLYL